MEKMKVDVVLRRKLSPILDSQVKVANTSVLVRSPTKK